jgi:hypothetical protein
MSLRRPSKFRRHEIELESRLAMSVTPSRPKSWRWLVGVVVVAVAAAASCGGGGSKKARPATATTDAVTTTTTAALPPTAPYTGLPDPTGAYKGRPSLNVKVDNVPAARPQTGLEAADIVWEEVVEGNYTRFLTMFQSQAPPVVGPVRSVRLTDPLIVWPVGGIFAYSGGAAYAANAINQAPVNVVDESRAGPAMFRDRRRDPPHNLYGRPAQLFALGGKPVPPPPLFQYARPGEASTGDGVAAFTVGFQGDDYRVTYSWDKASGHWLRSVRGRPFVMASGQQIAPTNVVVMFVQYKGGAGNLGAEASLVGQGDVWVFADGKLVKGQWIRTDRSKPAELHDAAGKPIRLVPGATWVELPDVSYQVGVIPAPPTP